ncbi:thiolase C-terminal domain-containing protein [Arthrobacter sp. ISL-95]|uniref:thiolase C-terminal domain-containing protein n=1 Tax=Arthrobacter sp. ISL-95 TaxID=2819116 RepID=UPI001BEC1EA4|nr:hypothetical protein [Arthrobacter sp. ISL-95]MBT2588435.1 hypothetical protein [Arthrobacter sp. ISL-95]
MTDRVAIAGIGMKSYPKVPDRSLGSLSGEAVRSATGLGGRVSVNPSGGLLSRYHRIGATRTAQIFELARQWRGEAVERRRESAEVASVKDSGGQLGGDSAAAAVSIVAA